MKVQNMPFSYYQMYSAYIPKDVLEWYCEFWHKQGLLAIGRENEKRGNIEAVDWKNNRFLNVFARRDKASSQTEIFATAITLPNPKKLKDELKNFNTPLSVEGKTLQGGTWKNQSWVEKMGVKSAFSLLVQRESNKGWQLMENKLNYPLSFAIFKKTDKEMNFFVLREISRPERTVIQEMGIRE